MSHGVGRRLSERPCEFFDLSARSVKEDLLRPDPPRACQDYSKINSCQGGFVQRQRKVWFSRNVFRTHCRSERLRTFCPIGSPFISGTAQQMLEAPGNWKKLGGKQKKKASPDVRGFLASRKQTLTSRSTTKKS